MQVSAVCTPSAPRWRWRITSYAGEVVAESNEVFATISAALRAGRDQLIRMDTTDHSEIPRRWSSRPYGRRSQ